MARLGWTGRAVAAALLLTLAFHAMPVAARDDEIARAAVGPDGRAAR